MVTFPPGGGTDLLARRLGASLQEQFGQSVVVENRPGASGNLSLIHIFAAYTCHNISKIEILRQKSRFQRQKCKNK